MILNKFNYIRKMSETKVITGKVRFSYANVHTARSMDEGSEPKYSTAILIPKSDKKTIAACQKAIKNAIEKGINEKWNGKKPANLKIPLRDGDEERPDDPVYENCYFFNASSKNKPQIVDADLNPIMSQDEFYSGCYGRASINFYPFNVSGNKGIAAGLNNLQKLEGGERLGGGSSAEDDFAEDFEENPLLG